MTETLMGGQLEGDAAAAEATATAEATAAAEKAAADAQTPEQKAAAEKAAADAQTPEQKAAAEKAAAEKAAKEAEDAVPEKYEFAMPEGQELDAALSEKFSGVAKSISMSQKDAQTMVDFYAEQRAEDMAQVNGAQVEAWDKQKADWVSEAKADKEVGGTEDNLKAHLANANKFIAAYGSPEMSKLLDDFGMGNNVHFIRAFSLAGATLNEDALHIGGPGGPRPKSLAEKMFPSHYTK